MSTAVRVAGWKSEGLRCPDHEVSFIDADGSVRPISLIQMPNGTGKTTTLELLRAALAGSASDGAWPRDKVRSLRKRGDDRVQGMFQVALLYNARRVTITMLFDFEEGTVRYGTTVSSGMKDGFHPPRELARFLHPGFVNFFVFDGELAEQLLSREHTDAQTVIEDLFQLRVFAEIESRVREYWESRTSNCGATEERGLSRRQNRVGMLRRRIEMLVGERTRLEEEHTRVSEELLKKKNRFNAALTDQRELHDRLLSASNELTAASAEVKRVASDVLAKMRDPHALSEVFADDMLSFKASLDRVKLPESTAREFFEELSQEELCVCGRELDDDTRKAIRDRAAQYLGSDSVALLNAIKGDVGLFVGPTADVHEQELTGKVRALIDSCRTENELRTKRDAIEAEGVGNDPQLEQAKTDIETLENTLRSLDDKLRRYDDMADTARDEEVFGIKVLSRRLEDAERKLAEITHTLALKQKRDVLLSLLQDAQNKARIGISAEICADANGRIEQLMPHNAIRIQEIDRCLILEGQEGGSVGETLSVAYAFLATLFNRTEHQLPFVVDSPANPIDLRVRAKVAELIPRLTEQFVAFTISSERQGFLAPLEAASTNNLHYVTLFRKGATDLDAAARGQAGVVESLDGFCIEGRDFFHSFHLDVEEGGNAV